MRSNVKREGGCKVLHLMQSREAKSNREFPVVSTSTRNFPNRLGKGANVYLSSAELAAVAAMFGKIPSVSECMEAVKGVEPMAADVYRYLNFHEIAEYKEVADGVVPIEAA